MQILDPKTDHQVPFLQCTPRVLLPSFPKRRHDPQVNIRPVTFAKVPKPPPGPPPSWTGEGAKAFESSDDLFAPRPGVPSKARPEQPTPVGKRIPPTPPPAPLEPPKPWRPPTPPPPKAASTQNAGMFVWHHFCFCIWQFLWTGDVFYSQSTRSFRGGKQIKFHHECVIIIKKPVLTWWWKLWLVACEVWSDERKHMGKKGLPTCALCSVRVLVQLMHGFGVCSHSYWAHVNLCQVLGNELAFRCHGSRSNPARHHALQYMHDHACKTMHVLAVISCLCFGMPWVLQLNLSFIAAAFKGFPQAHWLNSCAAGAMPLWERGSMVTSLMHCGAPKVGFACLYMWQKPVFVQVLIGVAQTLIGKPSLTCNVRILLCPEVLLMLWNADLRWNDPEYQLVELFSGHANASREWYYPYHMYVVGIFYILHAYVYMQVWWFRKRRRLNVASYDVLYGQRDGNPKSMDFCSAPGFVSNPQSHSCGCVLDGI